MKLTGKQLISPVIVGLFVAELEYSAIQGGKYVLNPYLAVVLVFLIYATLTFCLEWAIFGEEK